MFRMADLLTKRNGKVFISCLHTKGKKWDFYRLFSWYLLDGTMCGLYPRGENGLTKNANSFDVISCIDRTEDYRLSAVKASEGWQHRKVGFGLGYFDFSKKVIYFTLVDPFILHHLLSQIFDAWMSFYGDDPYDKSYNPEKRESLSFISLYMILLQKK
jgi:hypothetical protein